MRQVEGVSSEVLSAHLDWEGFKLTSAGRSPSYCAAGRYKCKLGPRSLQCGCWLGNLSFELDDIFTCTDLYIFMGLINILSVFLSLRFKRFFLHFLQGRFNGNKIL